MWLEIHNCWNEPGLANCYTILPQCTLVVMGLGHHNTVLCSHYDTLFIMNLCWHGTVLCGHHAKLVGMKKGQKGAILYGHQAIPV